MTTSEAFFAIKKELTDLYGEREAANIAHLYLEHVTGLGKLDRLTNKDLSFGETKTQALKEAISVLKMGKPIQQVIGIAWFYGRAFTINEHVLIPRPETEELVQMVLNASKQLPNPSFLDIGTGSGCIPITLKLEMNECSVTSCDISENALELAGKNAVQLGATISFLACDFLNELCWQSLGQFDVIVSNPPYIPLKDKAKMHKNVVEFEPHLALFVPNDDALVFYSAIAEFAGYHLNLGGYVFCELDPDNAEGCKELFEKKGLKEVHLHTDMQGLTRFISARK